MSGIALSPHAIPAGRPLVARRVRAGDLVERHDSFIHARTASDLPSAFLPAGDQASQRLASAGVLAVGSLTRALGGRLFGRSSSRRRSSTPAPRTASLCTSPPSCPPPFPAPR